MKVTIEKLDDINIIVSGTVEDEVTQAKVDALTAQAKKDNKELTQELNDAIQQSAESEVLKDFIEAGLKEANIPVEDVLGQPGFRSYEKRDKGIYIEIAVSTAPSIDTDIDYSDVVPTFTQPEVPADEVEAKLLEMTVQQAPFTAIATPKAVQNDDVTIIDFEGFVDGVAFEGGSAQKFNLKVGSNSFIPGFEEQMIGMEYAETRSVVVTFPKDYQSEDLAGKEAEFKVTLLEIHEQQALTADDAFAKKVLSDDKATLDTLRKKLAEQIQAQSLSQFYNDELKPLLIQGLLSKFDFTLPFNVVEQEIDAKVNERIHLMSDEEKNDLNNDKEIFHALRDSLRKEGEDSIKTALIVEALAKKEGLEADEQEVLSALYYQAMMSGQDAQELVTYYKENNLMHGAKMGLTQDKLFGKMLGFDNK